MPQKTVIQDHNTRLAAAVVNHHEHNALVVATRPLKDFENSIRFFVNDEYGADMNVNAATGGTPEYIHDGTDNVYWTASDVQGGGKSTFNSTDQNHTGGGTKSVKIDNSPINDTFQFAKGSDIDLTGYVSLSLWIYVDKDWKANDSVAIYAWDTDANVIRGVEVYLEDYFDFLSYDVWQKIAIPLTDMEIETITTVDAFRVRQIAKEGKAPKYYLDDIQLEETGIPISFSLSPDKGTWLYVEHFNITMVDAMAGTLADGTMPALPYDKFLDVSLVTGITYQREQAGKVIWGQTVKNTIELMQLPGTSIVGTGSDGTNTWVTFRVDIVAPLILKAEELDKLMFTINDNMSGLLHFRISAGCKYEERKPYMEPVNTEV